MIDDSIRAWVDRDVQDGAIDGPLSGVTFGVKDNIDVRAMPTGYGLLDRRASVATIDAWCVAALRAAGAIPVGKTHSTALASRDPAVTFHPWLPERTPGGSSAGSAAAVGAGHVPFALGTQTLGSVVRPASFCGVVGFKPSYGRIPMMGVAPMAPSFDTVGVIADRVATAARVAAVLLASPLAHDLGAQARVGWARSAYASRFTPEVHAMLDAYVAALDPTIFAVQSVTLDPLVDAMVDVVATASAFEAHAVLEPFRTSGAVPAVIDAMLARGATIAYDTYRAALAERDRLRAEACAALAPFNAVLLPIADEPPTRETTGDTIPQAPWTAWGMPAITVPVGRLPSGAPVGIGIVAAPGADASVLEIARRLEALSARR
jgi:Asp-tRNA(Asn)/Glu-tRNA(Gln) amidotransferase A subunit family amidase